MASGWCLDRDWQSKSSDFNKLLVLRFINKIVSQIWAKGSQKDESDKIETFMKIIEATEKKPGIYNSIV